MQIQIDHLPVRNYCRRFDINSTSKTKVIFDQILISRVGYISSSKSLVN